jgi:hypothetical protein
MRQISKTQMKRNRELAKIKKELSPYCFICGQTASDGAHLLPRSMYPEYYTEKWNVIPLCRICHNLYDNNLTFRKKQTKLIKIVKCHDSLAANRYFKL